MLATLQAKVIVLAGAFLLGGIATGTVAYKLHEGSVAKLNAEWEIKKTAAVDAAKAEVQKICDENNQTTKENARALQSKYNATLDRYYRVLQYNPKTGAGTNAPAGVAGGNDDAPGTDVPTLCIAVPEWALAAKRNDDQASALITLQDVVADIYRRNGQESLLPDEYKPTEAP